MLAQEVINPLGTVTSGGAAITNTATLLVNGASSAGTTNYALYVSSGLSQMASLNLTGGLQTNYQQHATAYTLQLSDYTIELMASVSGGVTLPTAVGNTGKIFVIVNSYAGTNNVYTTSSQNIGSGTYYTLTAQYKYIQVQSNGTMWQIIANN